jgi:NTE family protein
MSRIGLVLGAGGIAGHAFHAGVLDALASVSGWDPNAAEVVVGTSAGSGVGALLRGGLSTADIARRIAGEPLSPQGSRLLVGRSYAATPQEPQALRGRRLAAGLAPAAPSRFLHAALRPWDIRLGSLAAAALPEGRVPTDRVVAGLRRMYPDGSWPQRPLWVCAVRLHDGRRTVFGRDPGTVLQSGVPEAVAASCAIPAFFTPVRIDGVRYVDGGTWSPTNADVVAGMGLDLVVVVSPMSARRAVPSSFDGAVRAACRLQLSQEVLRIRRRGSPVLVLEPGGEDLQVMGPSSQAMDPERAPLIVRAVRESMRARLRRPELRERLRLLRS